MMLCDKFCLITPNKEQSADGKGNSGQPPERTAGNTAANTCKPLLHLRLAPKTTGQEKEKRKEGKNYVSQ